MKRVLITGKGSYIGTKVQEWLMRYPDEFEVDILDMIGDGWKEYDFSGYDCVYHVAGIAHRKDAPNNLYEQVNHILTIEVAKKAAKANVKQFIFMSSGAVYSQSDRKHKKIVVDENTPLTPSTPYGISKKRAEISLSRIKSSMKIAIVRPPMVYGPGAKGNYNSISKLAKISPIFPKIDNKRSMIYIDNLCEFIKILISKELEGTFLPQNSSYVSSTELVRLIAKVNNHKILLIPGFKSMISFLGKWISAINKVFGDFYYLRTTDTSINTYNLVDFKQSIIITEKKK